VAPAEVTAGAPLAAGLASEAVPSEEDMMPEEQLHE
jgi:hypothetical protein